MSTLYPNPSYCWVAGISFGAWIGMQLLMRRPEITGFVSIAPQANLYDFAFLAPCPASGLFVHGTKDQVVPEADVQKLVDRLTAQRGIKITYHKIDGANHFFDNHQAEVVDIVEEYVKKRMASTDGGR
jgi:alpha/beta superfamily hydrolase